MSNTALPIHWDRPCYKCRSSFCDGLCTPLPDPASNVFAAPWKSGDTPSLYKEGTALIHGIPCYTADQMHTHAAAVSAERDAEIEGLREASKSALLVLCALRDANDWHRNMVKDIDFAIEAARAALGDKTPTTPPPSPSPRS